MRPSRRRDRSHEESRIDLEVLVQNEAPMEEGEEARGVPLHIDLNVLILNEALMEEEEEA